MSDHLPLRKTFPTSSLRHFRPAGYIASIIELFNLHGLFNVRDLSSSLFYHNDHHHHHCQCYNDRLIITMILFILSHPHHPDHHHRHCKIVQCAAKWHQLSLPATDYPPGHHTGCDSWDDLHHCGNAGIHWHAVKIDLSNFNFQYQCHKMSIASFKINLN